MKIARTDALKSIGARGVKILPMKAQKPPDSPPFEYAEDDICPIVEESPELQPLGSTDLDRDIQLYPRFLGARSLELKRAILAAALCTAPAPPLPDDALVG